MLGALLGFAAPFLPDLIGLGKGWLDHKQEMQMMELRLKHAAQEHMWRVEEIEIQAASRDIQSARRQRESYGVQILNAAHDAEGILSKWTFNLVFNRLRCSRLVHLHRPADCHVLHRRAVGSDQAGDHSVRLQRETGDWVATLTRPEVWTDFDQDVLLMVVAYWFSDATLRRKRAAAR